MGTLLPRGAGNHSRLLAPVVLGRVLKGRDRTKYEMISYLLNSFLSK
jgi:hypothetical protein